MASRKLNEAVRSFVHSPTTLKTIFTIHGVLDCRWAPHHAILPSGQRYVGLKHVPVCEMLTRRWYTRTDPFWWNCMVSVSVGGTKATVRGWLRRRATAAIIESLRKNGYAKDGSRLPAENAPTEEDLVGTATFYVGPKLIHTSWKELQEKTDIIVSKIIIKTAAQKRERDRAAQTRLLAAGGWTAPAQQRSSFEQRSIQA